MEDDSVLDKIDHNLFDGSRKMTLFTSGSQITVRSDCGEEPCFSRGDDSVFLLGVGSKRLEKLMERLLSEDFRNGICLGKEYNHTQKKWITS